MRRSLVFCISLLIFSCKSGIPFFSHKNFHEQYSRKIRNAGLDKTAMGSAWLSAAEEAVNSPKQIGIPYQEIGYFASDKPSAAGYRFSARRGEKLLFSIEKNPVDSFLVFIDLWNAGEAGAHSHIISVDTSAGSFEHEVNRDGSFILRLQPELLKSGDYTLSISIGPSLAFPVAKEDATIGSFWGASRDAGSRSHEGIDIFSPRGTPAVAAADGYVTSVTENNLGGKVVFMRPEGKDYTLYYAHLDSQTISTGSRVKQGEQLGLVGNTGNARTTAPHLHFGIYTVGGAIDPLPFVDRTVKKGLPVSLSHENIRMAYRINRKVQIGNRSYLPGTPAFPFAASAKQLWMLMPDGAKIAVNITDVSQAQAIRSVRLKDRGFLFESPTPGAPRKLKLQTHTAIDVLGEFGTYSFVAVPEGVLGWIENDLF